MSPPMSSTLALYQGAILPDATGDKHHDHGVPSSSTNTNASTTTASALALPATHRHLHVSRTHAVLLDHHPREIDERTSVHARVCPAPAAAACHQRKVEIEIESTGAGAIRRACASTAARARPQAPESGPEPTTAAAEKGRGSRRRANGSASGGREGPVAVAGGRSEVQFSVGTFPSCLNNAILDCRWELFVPLHRLWLGYMSELLGLAAPPTPLPVDPSAAMPQAAGMHAKLVKADFHGSIVTGASFFFLAPLPKKGKEQFNRIRKVRRSKNAALVGASGIVVQETENTFTVVTQKDKLKGASGYGDVEQRGSDMFFLQFCPSKGPSSYLLCLCITPAPRIPRPASLQLLAARTNTQERTAPAEVGTRG